MTDEVIVHMAEIDLDIKRVNAFSDAFIALCQEWSVQPNPEGIPYLAVCMAVFTLNFAPIEYAERNLQGFSLTALDIISRLSRSKLDA